VRWETPQLLGVVGAAILIVRRNPAFAFHLVRAAQLSSGASMRVALLCSTLFELHH
jgi:hypothetical protein